MYKHIIRPILFALSQDDAEKAHELTIRLVQRIQRNEWLLKGIKWTYAYDHADLWKPAMVAGILFPNRIGLAAGLDKQAEMLPFMEAIGFGFVEIGSVLPYSQTGNPRPRLFRLPEHNVLRNQMGFNSRGAGAVSENLEYFRFSRKIPVGISIGKHKETPLENAADDYTRVIRMLYRHAHYFAMNVSSPNTPGLRQLQGADYLQDLVFRCNQAVNAEAKEHPDAQVTPIFVKLAPDLTDGELEISLQAIVGGGARGIILSNTTLQSPLGFDAHKYAYTGGGFSGPYLRKRMLEMVSFTREQTNLPIIACGGIWTPDDVKAARDAGADLVQILTSLVYEGPGIVRKLSSAL